MHLPLNWNEAERAQLQLLSIAELPSVAKDPTNKYADDPIAAKLGQKLFFDTALSINGNISCATCHMPEKKFTDGLAVSRGIGKTTRSAPSIIGIAHSPWFFWDGRSDSLWSQALGPLESSAEHGGNRSFYARVIYNNSEYKKMYESLFGLLPDLSDTTRFPLNAAPTGSPSSSHEWQKMTKRDQNSITRIFVNISKAIAAYERLLNPSPSRFDKYAAIILNNESKNNEVQELLSYDEIAGLKLFIGDAMCITCHQGPLFSNHGFHNIGIPNADEGRFKGIRQALKSEFNCLSEYSDAEEKDCAELKFANKKRLEILGAFKVPTLRNIAQTAPYMHAGQFKTLTEVLQHYNSKPKDSIGHNELLKIDLSENELRYLEAFLHSLTSSVDVPANLLQ